jgi:hypothetical protein
VNFREPISFKISYAGIPFYNSSNSSTNGSM